MTRSGKASWALVAICAVAATVGTAADFEFLELAGTRISQQPAGGALIWGCIAVPWVALGVLVAVVRVRRVLLWPHAAAALASLLLLAASLAIAAVADFLILFAGHPDGIEVAVLYGVWASVVAPVTLLVGAGARIAATVRLRLHERRAATQPR